MAGLHILGALDGFNKIKGKAASKGSDQVRSASGRAVDAMGSCISELGRRVGGGEPVKAAAAPSLTAGVRTGLRT